MHGESWFKTAFGHLRPGQWLVLIGGFVTVAITAGAFLILGVISKYSYVVFVISSTFVFLFDKVERYKFENQTADSMQKLGMQELGLHCIGDVTRGVEWFSHNSARLSSVYNTVFARISADDLMYTNDVMPEFERHLKQILENEPCRWRDLVTPNQVDVIDKFRGGLSPDGLRKHTYKVLHTDAPMLQIMILRYRDTDHPPAVLFGWGFPEARAGQVYLSQGRETVDYFQDYFNNLFDKFAKSPTHTSVPAIPMPDQVSTPPSSLGRRPLLSSR
jgi:hypothetical protein